MSDCTTFAIQTQQATGTALLQRSLGNQFGGERVIEFRAIHEPLDLLGTFAALAHSCTGGIPYVLYRKAGAKPAFWKEKKPTCLLFLPLELLPLELPLLELLPLELLLPGLGDLLERICATAVWLPVSRSMSISSLPPVSF